MKAKTKIELLIVSLYLFGIPLVIYSIYNFFSFSHNDDIIIGIAFIFAWLFLLAAVEHALFKKYGVDING